MVELVLALIGAFVVALAVAAVTTTLALFAWEFICAWWMIVRARKIKRRGGGQTRATLRDWARSIWRVGLSDGYLIVDGFKVPRSPFQKVSRGF